MAYQRLRRLGMILGSALAALTASPPASAAAQLVTSDRWYTVETSHFRIHFTKPLEQEGRRAAVDAERAFAQLASELRSPPGKIDLVVADNIDYVNGYATPYPSNRIVIFAHPPVEALELRNYGDWSQLVITHELTHIFHLDRADGLWRLGRSIFGRHPALFPNVFQPAWVIEGLAVYYESRITGVGRLEGSEHYMIARAAAEANRVPPLRELSRSTSRFPGGETVYAYGGLIFDYLSRTRGPRTIGRYVDVTSGAVFPLSLNARAKKAFGISFDKAWGQWRDSLVRTGTGNSEPLRGWRELTRDGRYLEFPRWLGDTALIYAASTGRETPAAYAVSLDGKVKRLGRRSVLHANVPLAAGGVLYSQLEYTDAFHLLNDLYIERDGHQRRLTRGARLSMPDARGDGAIVAVQAVTASARLARVSADGRIITPITTGDADTQWGEPRWSPDGRLIAALRLRRSGVSEIVVLDTLGQVRNVLVSERDILASPAWSRDGRSLYYTSARSGVTQVYEVNALSSSVSAVRVSRATTGLFSPEPSPNDSLIAARHFRLDGYHLGVAPRPPRVPDAVPDTSIGGPRHLCTDCLMATVIAPISLADVGPTRRYSPWQSLLPRYWEPVFASSSDNGTDIGAATSGSDIIGRHAYYAQGQINTKYHEAEAYAAYAYGGFGQPRVDLSAEQAWEHFSIVGADRRRIGDLARRARVYTAAVAFVRPRVQTSASFSAGGEIESRRHAADPDTLLAKLPATFQRSRIYPSVFASASWSNTQRPALSISREDGVSLSATARERWERGRAGTASTSIVGVAAAYKSLDLPGFAHHVVAARGAAGYADDRAISSFSAGGLSGGSLDVLSEVVVGGGRRTFGVRGFPPSAEQGIRAFAGSLEYRAPIAAPSRRLPFIPVLFDRFSATAFADAGRAYCPASAGESIGVCGATLFSNGPWLASAGGELDIDTALQYDVATRFRIGFAVPFSGRAAVGAQRVSFYFTVGSSF